MNSLFLKPLRQTETQEKRTWDALPAVYRQCAVAYTDFWSAYDEVFPIKRHQSVRKDSGKTSYIERFNCTLRSSSVVLNEKDLVVFSEVGEPYWCNLVLYSPLQCILTCLGLPIHYPGGCFDIRSLPFSYGLASKAFPNLVEAYKASSRGSQRDLRSQ